MLLIVLALFWVALLAPVAIRRLRDGGTEKSIQSFHAEHEILSRQDYSVAPAHRLDRPDQETSGSHAEERRPRLTVVHADDTFSSLESRSTWDEWSDDYDYDDGARTAASLTNRYAKIYSSRPDDVIARQKYETPVRRRTMKSQRRMVFARLVIVAVVLTLTALLTGSSLLFDVAAVSMLAVVAFVALAFYSVSQGYLRESSLPVRVPQRRQLATIEPLHGYEYEHSALHDVADFESEFYEPEADYQWDRQPQRRRALG